MANSIKDQNRLRKVYSFYRAQPVPLNVNIINTSTGSGLNQNQIVGVWIDAASGANQMTTTGSIAISAGSPLYASQAGADVWFFVSGSGVQDRSVFGTTALFSASVIAPFLTGSLTKTSTGLSYLVGGQSITITSQSNGQVVIAATTTISGTNVNNPWIDGNNKLKASSSVSIDSDNHFATDYGTDVFFYVSGSSGVETGVNRHVAVLPDLFISGGVVTLGQGPKATTGSIRLDNKGTIYVRNAANTANLAMAQADGQNNFIVGDPSSALTLMGSTQVYITAQAGYIIIRPSPGSTIYQDAATVTMRDALFGEGAILTVTGSRGIRWHGGSQPPVGTDTFFYVSGSIGLVTGADKKVTVFGGDVVASGTISGSIQKTATGASYLVAGTNVSIVSSSNGQVTINAASGAGSSGWVDGVGKMKTTGSISIDASDRYADAIGTDVFFFVSGSSGINSGANRKVVVLPDLFISGASISVGQGPVASSGSIRLDNKGMILARTSNNTNDLNIAQVDGANNLTIGDASFGASTIMYGPSQIILLAGGGIVAIEAATDIYLDGRSVNYRDASHVQAAQMTVTASRGVRWSEASQPAVGTDVFFFISGSQGLTGSVANADKKVTVLPDTVISGSLLLSPTGSYPNFGSIRVPTSTNIIAGEFSDSHYGLLSWAPNALIVGGDNNYLKNPSSTNICAQTSVFTVFVGSTHWAYHYNANALAELQAYSNNTPVLINQRDAGSGNGNEFVIRAQGTPTQNARGGTLILSGGAGTISGSVIINNGQIRAATFTSGALHLDDARTGSYPSVGFIRTPYYPTNTVLWNGLTAASGSMPIISNNQGLVVFGGTGTAVTNMLGVVVNVQSDQAMNLYAGTGANVFNFADLTTANNNLQVSAVAKGGLGFVRFGVNVTGSFDQVQSTSGKGATLSITPQQGANIGLNLIQDGGNLHVQGGSPTGTSLMGSVRTQLLTGSTTYNMVEVANHATGSRVLALVRTGSVNTTELPSAGGSTVGDLVVYIGNASTLPTTSSVNGGILYSDAGALKWYSPGGTQTTLAPNDPHCPRCGNDFVAEAKNTAKGWHRVHCFFCLEEQLAKIGIDPSTFAWTPKS